MATQMATCFHVAALIVKGPTKDSQKSYERMDGVVALVMGLGRAIVQPEGPASVYETRGSLTL